MNTASMSAWVEIDLHVIRKNIDIIRSLISVSTQIIGVVKYDAYGHGAVETARFLTQNGIDTLGVADVDEGIELRNAGISAPILIMNKSFIESAEKIVRYDMIPMVSSMDFAYELENYSRKAQKKQQVHIRVDTSDCSIGVKLEHFQSLLKNIRTKTNLSVTGVFTHLISSYIGDKDELKIENEKFHNFVSEINEVAQPSLNIHAYSSPGLFRIQKTHFTSVRIGTSLYGLPSFEKQNMQGIKPIMQVKTKIIDISTKNSRKHMEYQGVTQLNNKPNIAVIPIGYGNVPPLIHMKDGEVLIHGKRVPVLGKVFMGHMFADVTGLSNIKVGDEVVIVGNQELQCITVEEVARKYGIGVERCESICMLNSRMKRIYINSDSYL